VTVLFLRTSLAVLVEPAAPYQCTSLEVLQTFAFGLLVLVTFTWKLCVCVCACVYASGKLKEVLARDESTVQSMCFEGCSLRNIPIITIK
jgi:hypothetical protein